MINSKAKKCAILLDKIKNPTKLIYTGVVDKIIMHINKAVISCI